MKKLFGLTILFVSIVVNADDQSKLMLIGKCNFGDGSTKIEIGDPFLYIFGKRVVNGSDINIVGFRVEHDLAMVSDDITSSTLQNLNLKKVYPAEFPTADPRNPSWMVHSVHWKHEPIGGRSESTILNIISYKDTDGFQSNSQGTQSALAYRVGFSGVYPSCWILAMPR